jgi:hypothetical protein
MVDAALDAHHAASLAISSDPFEAMRAALTAALAAMWRPVETELPKMDEVVLIIYNGGFNGRPVITFGARIDSGEGWLWGVKRGYGADVHLDKDAGWNEIDADDDYEVTHWQPLTAPLPSPPRAEG